MQESNKTLILSSLDVQRIIQNVGLNEFMDQLIAGTHEAFLEFDKEKHIIPIRSGFSYMEPREGLVEWMPLRNKQTREILMKLVAYHPHNPADFGLPTILSTISKYDTSTGHLKVLMDGVLPTSLRTGAASAVASKLFGHGNSKKFGLIGCGAQSVTQLHALSRIFDLDEVLYFDVDKMAMNSFKDRISSLGLDIILSPNSMNEIITQADIVSTATSIGIGEGPLFEYTAPTKSWLHINAIGSDFEGKTELPKELLKVAYVSPDFREQAIIEGECQQLESTEIGEDIISCIKSANKFTHLKEELTVFDSTGLSLEDEVVADLLTSYAEEMKIGNYVQLEYSGEDEKNPYAFMMKNLKTT